MLLQNGQNHSCHHPVSHLIPKDKLLEDPSTLHNTPFKLEQRELMLQGKRPAECDYCWKVEDLKNPDLISDRYIKSSDAWAAPYFAEVLASQRGEKITPSYLEVSFSNLCNFQCIYCSAQSSSKWVSDVNASGPYKFSGDLGEYHSPLENPLFTNEEENPYLQAFWAWWPDIIKKLKFFRITGGEPLLSKSTKRCIDWLVENPQPELSFSINSNLGSPSSLVETFADSLCALQQKKAVKEFLLYTSIDTWGKQAEYLRRGLDMPLFEKNIDTLLKRVPDLKLTFMVTFNALSPFHFKDFLKKALELKKNYPVLIDISYLRHPNFLDVKLLPQDALPYFEESLEFMRQNNEGIGMQGFEFEIVKMERLIEYFKGPEPSDLSQLRQKFVDYTKELDRRHKTNFLAAFPELKSAYQEWNNSATL